MHKRFVNHCTIDITIIPDGPILIKSGREGADPTKPQMEFVETFHNGIPTIYLPGSSLKGAIRAHAERIVRTVGHPEYEKPSDPKLIWANNPLDTDKYDYLYENPQAEQGLKKKLPAPAIYKESSFTDQIFGNIAIASRFRIEDAYPDTSVPVKIEERNGVAIDRVFGSVAHGPFDYQVCTGGAFKTKIHLKNFSLAQLGLIALVMRDLNAGWFGIGFAKSRGLGIVHLEYNSAVVQYPGCILDKEGQIYPFGSSTPWDKVYLAGAGEFLQEDGANPYGFPSNDKYEVAISPTSMEYGFGVELRWEDKTDITELFMQSVAAWSKLLEEGGALCATFG
ncbi:CRISPR-associated protein [Scytonema hofmannii FACHB-248]|uniref:CRISPR-associated protein n=1 Tax=Scytonema hofmannii FACHB-248 TaxID=1842502 RepID=A0ABR8GL25_9CYAN|nr:MULTISPECIES: RAMP superfamily CRISPR-associated protein [Nostocales]MBD2603863.1 CRISPR-associated protein [Scytonema hofmannii FACHB-248]